MYPNRPDLYSSEVKAADAVFIRQKGAVLLERSSDSIVDNTLKICYRRYQGKSNESSSTKTKLNLVLFHGTGMNKGLWHYHINKLFEFFNTGKDNGTNLHLNVVCAFDAVNHGESAELNKSKLGYLYDWRDSSKDVVKVLTEDEAATFIEAENKMSIIIGHSMGGFVSLYGTYLAPALFDSCILVNPVSHVSPSEYAERDMEFKVWYERNYMKDNFDIQDGNNWYNEIESFLKTKSFYRKFHPTVLANLLEDELPKEVKQSPKAAYNKIKLNTTVEAQLHTYWGMVKSIPCGMPTFREIKVPVFHIVSDFDISSDENRSFMRNNLSQVVQCINFPNSKHLLNGEEPDPLIKLFTSIIQGREVIHSRKTVIDEEYLVKKYGKNYRKLLSDARLESLIKNGATVPKL
ncbi:DEHA2E09218p [Debaryomyces hansenii CBS767]|uniref:DEHA2E09218p n=1 Tax=Debaryomyces hansenii (strain ATCC 36239 / CBS 767 / BCRC 21394 / JCM 1990 / NBRC 0083 / IGC 2968) TaxID=284592 RepID=Q6BQ11_DEBHA|nr:DEHA2E09218p [Debaryomyces hansenii CBS767]CAG87945.2 DEHA2E09218p [Debaryomyces hansenii CBS767]|eukprot:XP_459709.2 DEHA2E09218p [Debaryomyces hansenii CBS767]